MNKRKNNINKYKKGSFFEVDGVKYVSNGVYKEGGKYLVETIDLWSVEVEGCNDLNEQNNKLRAKLGLKEWEVVD